MIKMEKAALNRIFKEKNPAITKLMTALRFIVFFGMIYTAFIMYKLRNFFIGNIILIVLALFIIFNKIESIDRRIKTLEKNAIEEVLRRL